MLKRVLQTAFVVFPTLIAVNSTASAATETFNFSYLTGWNGTDTSLAGSFTGTVEPDGLIELSDLTSFTATLITGAPPPVIASIDLSELTEFSYDTTGGVSSLSYIASVPVPSPPPIYWCAGASAVLDLACNPGGANPTNVRANLVNGSSLVLYTTDFPEITRVPEARTWAMLLLGFAGMGFARAFAARKRRRAMAFEAIDRLR
jgi:hypothetical protein